MQICVEQLTEEAFLRFGCVLGEPQAAEPTIVDEVSHVWVGISELMGIGRARGRQVTYLKIHGRPQKYDAIEKHETSAEVFIPLEGKSILLVVPAEAIDRVGKPDMTQAKAFLMDGSRGVLLRRGTWHAVPYSLTDVVTYLVLVDDQIIPKQDIIKTPIEPVEFILG